MGWAKRFAKEGIGALVHDKRGAGKSGGDYEGEQSVSERNIALLADDAVSALKRLSSHPSLKGVPVGLAGISQAGWIGPLAAEKSNLAKFCSQAWGTTTWTALLLRRLIGSSDYSMIERVYNAANSL